MGSSGASGFANHGAAAINQQGLIGAANGPTGPVLLFGLVPNGVVAVTARY